MNDDVHADTKTSEQSARSQMPSPLPKPTFPAASPRSSVDTSNLTPGAAARYEKLMRSIDNFTTAVQNKTITLPKRK